MNAKGKDWIVNTWASIIKSLRSTSLSTTAIPLPDQSTNPNIGNDSINDSDYTDRTVFQVSYHNPTSNNSVNGNQRTAGLKKPAEKKYDFLWY
jgi:hypothetical protein